MNWMILIIVFFLGVAGNSQEISHSKSSETIHVHTAMDHVSILQFGDPVTKVAAGSSGFQIERDGNTVLIKPLKPNAATDLLVWTASNRYAYELDPPGEVKNMTVAIDAPRSENQSEPEPPSTMADVAHMVLVRAFLGSQSIDSSRIKPTGPVDCRIVQIFRSTNYLYIHYALRNLGQAPIKLTSVTLNELVRTQGQESSLAGILHKQIDEKALQGFGTWIEKQVTVYRTERLKDLLGPGDQTQGVIVVDETISSPALLRLSISSDTTIPAAKAIVVF